MSTTQEPTDAKRPDVVVDHRPWGNFRQYTLNEPSTVKIITVAAGEALSLQRHEHRDELWVVLDDGLLVELDGTTTRARAGDEFFVTRGRCTGSPAASTAAGSSRSPSAGSTRTTSNGSRTATAAEALPGPPAR
jgi:mannose-6-phosphate isomerase-like protein (cupin superfamily)